MKMRESCVRSAAFGIVACALLRFLSAAPAAAQKEAPVAAGSVLIPVELPKAAYVTVVIDDAQGNRVRNLVAETYLPAGKSVIAWDGYDEGIRKEGEDDVWTRALTRKRVAPGTYTIRGLTHDKLTLKYEFSVNSPGSPPWQTKDGSGAWLADHSPPADILYLPKGAPSPNNKGEARFLVCASSGEAGDEFVWLNREGRRLYGRNTGFWGGTHFALDPGPKADPDIIAYTFISGERDPDNDNIETRAIHKNGDVTPAALLKFPLAWKKMGELPQFKTTEESYGSNGMAVYNGIVVFTVTRQGRVVFADARTHKILGEDKIAAPRSLTFDNAGRLYLISGRRVLRFDKPDFAGAKLGKATPLITTNLEDPVRIARDSAGKIYVSDWGKSHQVKIFTAEGKFVRAIGKPGGLQRGPYDDRRMQSPSGVTIDGAGHLWVAEADNAPRRLSVWNPQTGAFIRAIYGASQYGGGGKIDPANSTRLYMDACWGKYGVAWALDWQKGEGRPYAIYWRGDDSNVEATSLPTPETIFSLGENRYMTNAYNDWLRYNTDRNVCLWRLGKDEIARPVGMFGNGADLVNQTWGVALKNRDAIAAQWKNLDPATVFYVWTDTNGDHFAQPNEVQFRQIPSPKDGRPLKDVGVAVQIMPDLSLSTIWGVRIAAPTIGKDGIPRYDLSKITFAGDTANYSERFVGGGNAINFRLSEAGVTGSAVDGTRRWKLQSSAGGQPTPGQLIQPNRILGLPVTPKQGESGPILAINGEKGSIALVTLDGLFVQNLGGDMRVTPPLRAQEGVIKRGSSLDGYSFVDEHFHPTISQSAKDGTIYLVVGKESSNITRLDGWESVKRVNFGKITVGDTQLAAVPAERIEPGIKTQRQTATIRLLDNAPTLTGFSDASVWPVGEFVPIDARASASLAVSGDTLYAAWKTGDPNALNGGPGDFRYQFKRGGALDIQLGTAPDTALDRQQPVSGDLRLLITQVEGKPRAVLFRQIAPHAPQGEGVLYASPIGRADFAQVIEVTDKVRLTADGRGGFGVAVPLSLLGLKSLTPGTELLGDIGLLRGDGSTTTQRVYWNNQNTNLVSDIPGEARLSPGNWGVWKIR